jgi:perosamine synthetase
MKIPQMSPWLDARETQAVAAAIADNWITEGPKSAEFSRRLNELMGAPYGVFAPNGTLALVLGLMALGIEAGDEVLVPDTTFVASATATLMLGASPVLVDVEPVTFQIDVSRAEHFITPRTRAIMPVHLYGASCDMGAVTAFASKHGLRVIEDAAQGVGVFYQERHVGTFSDVGCFSFFADKTLTTGEGGYVVTNNPEIYDRLRYLRNQGRLERGSFIHPMVGFNFRITDLQAAIGLAQMDKLAEVIARKSHILECYRQHLGMLSEVRILGAPPGSTHVPFRCVLMAARARELEAHLAGQGIETRSFFYPLHRQPCLIDWAQRQLPSRHWKDECYPNAISGFEKGVCLPAYPTLTDTEIRYIGQTIRDFYGVRA